MYRWINGRKLERIFENFHSFIEFYQQQDKRAVIIEIYISNKIIKNIRKCNIII